METDTNTDTLNAVDLQTVSAVPMTPYRRGFEDAYYSAIYYCPYERHTDARAEYDKGHEEGSWERCRTANAR